MKLKKERMALQKFQHVLNIIRRNESRILYASTFATNIFNAIEKDIFTRDILIESLNSTHEEYRDPEQWKTIDPNTIIYFTYRVIGYDDLEVYTKDQTELDHGKVFQEENQAYEYYHAELNHALKRINLDIAKTEQELNLLKIYQVNMLNRKSVNFELWVEEEENNQNNEVQ